MNRQAVLDGLAKVEASRCDCATVGALLGGLQTPGQPFQHGLACWKDQTAKALRGFLAAAETRPDLTDRQGGSVEDAGEWYPAVFTRADNLLHVYKATDDIWCVWLNTQVSEFDGLCIGLGETRQLAVQQAVNALEAATDHLQGPPW